MAARRPTASPVPAQNPPPGRQTTLTPELLASIAEAAEAGLKNPQIYALLSIPKQTWSDWTNEKGEHFQADLPETLERARARLALRLLKLIPTMEKGWQAPVWMLTQHFPKEYARPNADTTVNVNAKAEASASAALSEQERMDFQSREKKALEVLIDGRLN